MCADYLMIVLKKGSRRCDSPIDRGGGSGGEEKKGAAEERLKGWRGN